MKDTSACRQQNTLNAEETLRATLNAHRGLSLEAHLMWGTLHNRNHFDIPNCCSIYPWIQGTLDTGNSWSTSHTSCTL